MNYVDKQSPRETKNAPRDNTVQGRQMKTRDGLFKRFIHGTVHHSTAAASDTAEIASAGMDNLHEGAPHAGNFVNKSIRATGKFLYGVFTGRAQ